MSYGLRLYSSETIACDAGIVYDQTEALMQDEINADLRSVIARTAHNIAAEYDNTATYAVGSRCIHDNKFYICNTSILVAESWTLAHWTEVTVNTLLTNLQTDLSEAEVSVAPLYSDSETYSVDDYCIHNDQLYICTTDIPVAESWTDAHWTSTTVVDELAAVREDVSMNAADIGTLNTKVTNLTNSISDAYSSSATYALGDLCIYNNRLYRCTTAVSTAEAWNSSKWTATSIAKEIGEKDLVFTIVGVNSLPKTFTNVAITADHVVSWATLSNPAAQTGDWTVTTARSGSSGTVTISGTISGTTNITLVLTKATTIADQTT